MKSLLEIPRRLLAGSKTGQCVAVEFDGRTMRLLAAEGSGAAPKFHHAVERNMPEETNLADATVVGNLLGEILREHGLRGYPLVLGVPRSQVVLKPLLLPAGISDAELPAMIHFQVQQQMPLKQNETVIDFMIEDEAVAPQKVAPRADENAGENAEPPAPQISVLVAAVQQSTIDFYVEMAKVAGATLAQLGLRSQGNLRCALACHMGQGAEPIALVHVTAQETQVDLIIDGRLALSRPITIRLGNDTATDAQTGQNIATEAFRIIRSFQAVQGNHAITQVIVAGGCATAIDAMTVELEKLLSLPVRVIEPFANLKIRGGIPANSPGYFSLAGLAMGPLSDPQTSFDFLHPRKPPVQRDPRRERIIVAASIIGLVVLGVVVIGAMRINARQTKLMALRSQINQLTQDNKRVAAIGKRLKTLTNWTTASRPWLDQWAYLSAIFPSATQTYITTLKTTTEGDLTLTVKARTPQTIADLGKRLANHGYDFRPGPVTAADDPFGYNFTSDIRIRIKPEMKVDLGSVQPEPRPENDSSPDDLSQSVPQRKKRNRKYQS